MKKISMVVGALSLILVVSGCATKRPPPELVDARAAYDRAHLGPATQMNPAGLYSARKSLEDAERKWHDDPGSEEARHLAYLAHRKTLLAESQARTTIAQAQNYQAQVALAQLARARLARAEGKLETQADRLAKAERESQQAWQGLAAFAAVKDEARGKVITLSGSVLFESNKAELMPTAKERLDEVVAALKAYDGRPLAIVGHTDNVGTDQSNKELSQRRADAVRDYLASKGIRPDLLRSEGRGEAEPISDNNSPETRANNRRVEIIVEPKR
jgi:outer membrane protein OmpA-like peptidoglycan-associated protein